MIPKMALANKPPAVTGEEPGLAGRKILVTGGAGFIGSHLCEALLARGAEVISLDNFSDNYPPALKKRNISGLLKAAGFTSYHGDIRDYSLLEKINRRREVTDIVHLAALAGVRKSLQDPLEYVDVDIKGTVNILEFAARHRIKRFIFASSSSVYGAGPLPFRETDRADRPVSPYAAAKRAGELFCRVYHELYRIPVACLRFFTVYGPRQRPDMAVNFLTRLIARGQKAPVYGYGEVKRDFTYISDVVDGIIRTLLVPLSYDLFNLGSAEATSVNRLVELISKELGKKPVLVPSPLPPGDTPATLADLSHSRRVLGYTPKVSLAEGIKRFIAWFVRQGTVPCLE